MPSALLWASLAENIFIIAIQENLRIFLNCFFTKGGRKGKQHLQRHFLRKCGAAEKAFRLLLARQTLSGSHSFTSSPEGGSFFAVTVQFPDKVQALRMRQKFPLSGYLANPKNLTERVHPTKRAAV